MLSFEQSPYFWKVSVTKEAACFLQICLSLQSGSKIFPLYPFTLKFIYMYFEKKKKKSEFKIWKKKSMM